MVAIETASKRLGVIGYSDGNGHPFSFSAIVNGYDDRAFSQVGWPVIHDYLGRRNASEFGLPGVSVTHAWMPDPKMARALAAACRIPHVVTSPGDMLGSVDAVLILRDDAESHWPMAHSFLESGVSVFVDKPLAIDQDHLEKFSPYLHNGRLMSCAALRFAVELDPLRDPATLAALGPLHLVECSVLNDWPRYGIHMLEAVQNLLAANPVSLQRLAGPAEHMAIQLDTGVLLLLSALGEVPKVFEITLRGRHGTQRFHLHDNFSAFRRVLQAFVGQARTGVPAIRPSDTLAVLNTIKAGLAAKPGGPAITISR